MSAGPGGPTPPAVPTDGGPAGAEVSETMGTVEAAGHEVVIGLEIHVQLRTRTKMFCGCELSFGDPPNVHTCPICLGHPGTLPLANRQAVHHALLVADALECEVAERSLFHRKNYFYPDLPKGYQISQYDMPLATAGRLGDVRIHRAHLEEDAAKLTHVGGSGRIHDSGSSLVDFNRGGTPLLEIVTEPDVRSPAHARQWLQLLRATVRALGVSDANMEQGSLRCDANVSLRPAGAEQLGVKTELKNMNSFRFIERGLEAELRRQLATLEAGGAVEQATMHYDPATGALSELRSKEHAHDYRYFPEPDLVPLAPTAQMRDAARAVRDELPLARWQRLREQRGLADETARQLAFEPALGDYLDAVLEAAPGLDARVAAAWVTGELVARLREGDHAEDPGVSQVAPARLAELLELLDAGEVSQRAAKDVLGHMVATGAAPAEIVAREGLAQVSDAGELESMVERAIAADPAAAEKVRAGEAKAIGPLVGAVMRESRGRADGGRVTALIREKLGG